MSGGRGREQVVEIKSALCDPMALCERLGLLGGKGTFIRQGAHGVTIRCPLHKEKTPSCSVTRGPDGTVRMNCFGGCGGGDALTLIAAAMDLSLTRDFKQVLLAAATIAGLHALADEIRSGAPPSAPRAPVARPLVATEPEKTYPPAWEVEELLGQTIPCDEDGEVALYLSGRGIDPDLVGMNAGALQGNGALPRWAARGGVSWMESGHRLIFPVRDAEGVIRSVRAGRVRDGDSPKRLPPGGHRAAGLVLADELGVAWLAGRASPARVLVCEGEPDHLVACQWKMSVPTARIGILSGSWTPALARKCRPGMPVLVWTHRDVAGDKYADEIARSLLPRGVVLGRWARDAA